jgi:hypothetical protein
VALELFFAWESKKSKVTLTLITVHVIDGQVCCGEIFSLPTADEHLINGNIACFAIFLFYFILFYFFGG